MGDPASADFRGRPARVSHLPRRHANRRLHHPDVGDRPDPRAPPDPRRARGARRGAEPPINAGPREPGGVTRPTPVRRRSACHLSAVRTPRHHAGTFGVGGGPTGATDWPPPASLPPRCPPFPRPSRRTNASTGQRARRHPPVGARAAGDRALYSTDSRPAPIEIPIP